MKASGYTGFGSQHTTSTEDTPLRKTSFMPGFGDRRESVETAPFAKASFMTGFGSRRDSVDGNTEGESNAGSRRASAYSMDPLNSSIASGEGDWLRGESGIGSKSGMRVSFYMPEEHDHQSEAGSFNVPRLRSAKNSSFRNPVTRQRSIIQSQVSFLVCGRPGQRQQSTGFRSADCSPFLPPSLALEWPHTAGGGGLPPPSPTPPPKGKRTHWALQRAPQHYWTPDAELYQYARLVRVSLGLVSTGSHSTGTTGTAAAQEAGARGDGQVDGECAATAPCVTFRLVVAPLRGPGRSPVLPFACCVGSLLSVGRCGWCFCWCCFRVRGAQ